MGSALARFALVDVRAQGRGWCRQCVFIKGWIDKHPEYAALLAEGPGISSYEAAPITGASMGE